MGKKDVTGRMFFSDRERFAELLNLHFYHGEQVLLPENLIRRKGEYPSLADVYGQKNRDILMEDTKRKIYYGVELETETDYSMSERVMVYDACEYEQQIRRICRKHREKEEFKNYREMKSRRISESYTGNRIGDSSTSEREKACTENRERGSVYVQGI